MTVETSKEIIKAYLYGISITDIAELYGYDIDVISKLIIDNEDVISKEYEYRNSKVRRDTYG